MGRRLSIPPARPLLGPLRSVDEARTSVTRLQNGRWRLTIDHEPLAGITPPMLHWWFRQIGDPVSYAGTVMSGYLAWHPLDHIHWELARPAPGGGAGEGARFHVVEAFGRHPQFYLDDTLRVEKLDETGIRLVYRILGANVMQLEHVWSAGIDGAHYVSIMELGVRPRWLAPANRWLIRGRFPEPMMRAWIVHNIEEVGYLELILPEIYASASRHNTLVPYISPNGSASSSTRSPSGPRMYIDVVDST